MVSYYNFVVVKPLVLNTENDSKMRGGVDIPREPPPLATSLYGLTIDTYLCTTKMFRLKIHATPILVILLSGFRSISVFSMFNTQKLTLAL